MTAFLVLAGSLAYGLGTLSASIPRWTALYLFSAWCMVLLAIHLFKRRPVKLGACEAWLSALLGYFALSLLWSPDPGEGFVRLVNAFSLVCVFLYARHRKPSIGPWVRLAVLLALGACFVWPEDTGGFGNRNFATEFFLLCLPLLWLDDTLASTVSATFLSVMSLSYLLFINASNIEFLVFLVWGGCFIGYLTASKWKELLLFLGLGLLAMFLLLPASHFLARYELWIQTVFMWLDHPLLGVGLGGYDYVHPLYRETHVPFLGPVSILLATGSFAGAAHNEYLQILAELGLAGFVLAVGFAVSAVKGARLDRMEGWALAAVGGMALIGFPLQNPDTAMLAALSLGLLSET